MLMDYVVVRIASAVLVRDCFLRIKISVYRHLFKLVLVLMYTSYRFESYAYYISWPDSRYAYILCPKLFI